MNPQFFKLYQGDHENTAWWDLRHCVIFSGGIFFFFLAVLEWEVSAFLLSVHSCIPDMCRGLCCCHTSRLALGQHRVQFIFRVASEGEEMCSAWGCVIGAMGDGSCGWSLSDLPAKGLGAGSCCWTCPLHLTAALRPSDTIEL